MKALRTKICTYAIALLASIGFATPTLAGSSDFSGIFIAGHAELNVVAIDGSSRTGRGDDGNPTTPVSYTHLTLPTNREV